MDPIPVEMLCVRKCEILNKVDTLSVVFDPVCGMMQEGFALLGQNVEGY